jgi:DNA-binding transcriptional ArsR family regulator
MDDIKILQAIAEPTRLAIVRQLASDGEVCACDFTDCCGVSQPTVSHHLKAAARIAALGHLLSAGARREPKRVAAKPALARA